MKRFVEGAIVGSRHSFRSVLTIGSVRRTRFGPSMPSSMRLASADLGLVALSPPLPPGPASTGCASETLHLRLTQSGAVEPAARARFERTFH